ncbi:MAG: TatD family hydrolase [Lentisphaeria bacterium]|nr:TatD family hydrolase [Lentisphaeria bacterium]
MTLFDTHTHYSGEDGPFPEWYARAAAAGVPYMLICSSGWENTALSKACAAHAPEISFAAGIHPQEAGSEAEKLHPAEDYAEFTADPKCAAVGEIGLDYYYENAPESVQRELFDSFLRLALTTGKPAVIHCRDKSDSGPAYEHAYEHLKAFSRRGGRFVLHAFSGSVPWLERFLELGAFFGVGGMVTFKKADNIRELVLRMPPDRILLETDAPYLAPVPHRGKPNHPALLPCTAAAFASLRGLTVEEAAELTLENAFRFLGIGKGAAPDA